MTKRAIIHVENTQGIVEFARFLIDSGWTILSANKTEEFLLKENIPVTKEPALVENNLYVHDTSKLIRTIISTKISEESDFLQESKPVDDIPIVCMNLNPMYFKELSANQIRKYAKPYNFYVATVLRNAFVNYENLLILTDPADYQEAIIQLRTNNVTPEFRTYLAAKALSLIAAYDAGISASILQNSPISRNSFMNYLTLPYKKQYSFHNGSNSHQNACFYQLPTNSETDKSFQKIQGKELTYNIVSDVSFALNQMALVYSHLKNQFSVTCTNYEGYNFTTQFTPLTGTVFTIAIKYKATLGAALSTNVVDSFKNTYSYDYENVKDATLCCSAVIDEEAALEISKGNFISVIAPGFTQEAKTIFAKNRDLRLFSTPKTDNEKFDFLLANEGLLFQTNDNSPFNHWNVVTKTRPSQILIDQMAFGVMLTMRTNSCSAALLKNHSIVGISHSASSSTKAIRMVSEEAKDFFNRKNIAYSKENNIADILASDSSISLTDELIELIQNGLKAIIQPGDLNNDNQEFIDFCNEHGVSMIFTKMPHITY